MTREFFAIGMTERVEKKNIDDQWEEISLGSVCSHWVSLIYPESKRERKESIFCSFLSVDALPFSSALYTVRWFS